MNAKYFYYHWPKAVFAASGLLAFIVGLAVGAYSTSDIVVRTICIVLLVVFSIVFYFLMQDCIVLIIQNKPVLIVDSKGIADVVSWGLIKWSNIKDLQVVEVRSQSNHASYRFKEMRIVLKELNDYDGYNNSRWIRFKMKFNRIYRGGTANIIIDIDALKGDVNEVFKSIEDSFVYFTSNRKLS